MPVRDRRSDGLGRAGAQAELLLDVPATERLTSWVTGLDDVAPDWRPLVDGFLASAEGRALESFVRERIDSGVVVYPPRPLRAFALTPRAQVRVVILGQDPYHGPGQAEGLAFSVPSGVKAPPSLRNIFKELQRDLGLPVPPQGSLVRWASQGVLLLNACLTVEEGHAGSHAGRGWETLTDAAVRAVAQSERPVVFMLWGAHAQAKRGLIEQAASAGRHALLTANHPSPLSASRPPQPFLGCGHFSRANAFLVEQGEAPVVW